MMISILGILFFAGTLLSQVSKTDVKNIWKPPDSTFSLQVPVPLEEEEGDFGDESGQKYKSIVTFGGRTNGTAFLLVVIEPTGEQQRRLRKTQYSGLEFILAGEGDRGFSSRFIKVNGLDGKEISFDNRNIRGMIIDAKEKIYILGVITKTRNDLDATIAKCFLQSFRLLKTD